MVLRESEKGLQHEFLSMIIEIFYNLAMELKQISFTNRGSPSITQKEIINHFGTINKLNITNLYDYLIDTRVFSESILGPAKCKQIQTMHKFIETFLYL